MARHLVQRRGKRRPAATWMQGTGQKHKEMEKGGVDREGRMVLIKSLVGEFRGCDGHSFDLSCERKMGAPAIGAASLMP